MSIANSRLSNRTGEPAGSGKRYSLGEEIANSITHGLGMGLGIAGLTVLVVMAALRGTAWHIVSFSIFGVSLILLYTASTFYHSLTHPRAKRVFKILDHSAIFLLIAGTYTPFTLVSLRGPLGWTLFGGIWALAALGIIFKSVFITRFQRASVGVYIFMGWICVLASKAMLQQVPRVSLILLVGGGLSYTVGVVFYLWRRMPFNHAVWHLFVLGGSILHFFAVLNIL